MAPTLSTTPVNNKKSVSFDLPKGHATLNPMDAPLDEESTGERLPHAPNVLRDPNTNGLPAAQGLFSPEFEKDACGVGFVCHVKGKPSHKIVSDAKALLCESRYEHWVE